MSPRIENSASRTRSDVGRVARPFGVERRRPPQRPATILTSGASVAVIPAWSDGKIPPICLVPTMPDLTTLTFGRVTMWSIQLSSWSAVECRSSAKQHVLRFGSPLEKPAPSAVK